ncbi:MAG: threonine/serine exporter family protein [Coriobacteriia bacterium]|nr:threonine/serine exporter family protein [Coriobacteriia bacterium]
MEARYNKILMLAVRAGEIMLKSGAEVYRAEDTVERLCRACDIPYVQSFFTTTGIFASLGDDERSMEIQTVVRRVKSLTTDLEKVSLVNSFVRRFIAAPTHSEEDIDKGLEELERIDAIGGFSLPIRLLAMFVIAVAFTMLNGGSLTDGLCTIAIATITYLFSLSVERLRINGFIVVFASCFLAAALSLLIFNLGFCSSLGAMIVGSIVVFLPGVAITNAARDLLSGDMLAGVARSAESMLLAIAIAGGVGMCLRFAPLPVHADFPSQFILPLGFLFAFLGTMGVAVIVNIPRRYLVLAGLIAACGWLIYELVVQHGSSSVYGCFLGTCSIALLAEIVTRITKDAATLFIIPAIFPLVPGKVMYNAMLQFIDSNPSAAISALSEALLIAGGIAVALLVMISLTRIASTVYHRFRSQAKR